jgi:hypothetical protein
VKVQVHVQPVQVQRICGSHPEAGDVDDEGQATSQAQATSGMKILFNLKLVSNFGLSAILAENLTAVIKAEMG